MQPKKIIPKEEDDQRALADCLDRLGLCWFHVPNEIKCSAQYLRKRARLGVKKGVLDNFIFNKPPKFPKLKGAIIEMKRKKGGKISDEQYLWAAELSDLGWAVGFCNGIDEALQQLRDWGYMK
jgi:hypothetical protein